MAYFRELLLYIVGAMILVSQRDNPQNLGIIYLGGKLIDRLYQVFYSIGKDQEASKWRKHQDSRTARA